MYEMLNTLYNPVDFFKKSRINIFSSFYYYNQY